MLKMYGRNVFVALNTGTLMTLIDWEPVENFAETVEKHFGVKPIFWSDVPDAHFYFIPSTDNIILKKIEDYALFRILPGMACLD